MSAAGTRRAGPPGTEFFAGAARRAPLGPHSAGLDLAGLSIGFAGMDEAWRAAFLRRFDPHARDRAASPFCLTLSASRARLDHFIEPPPSGVADRNPVLVAVEPDPAARGHWLVRACTYALAASFSTAGGDGAALFARADLGPLDPRERAVENILRVAAAWLAVARDGLLMHSASIVKEGRAYLFFGQSGAGKSTLASLSRRGQVVSDDLTLILPGDAGRADVVGAPFRGTYTGGAPLQGRYPIAAAFRLRKAAPHEAARVEPLAPARAMAEAIANLPFVVDQLPAGPALFDAVEQALGRFPIHALRFRRQGDSYWDAIAAAGY